MAEQTPARRQIPARFPPDLYAEIEKRAKARGMSVNDWINKACTFAIAAKDPNFTTVTKTRHML